MKNVKFLGLLFLMVLCFSCRNDALTQEEEARCLEELLDEIKSLATSATCNDASAWTFTSYGSKACGGPMGYIAYSTNIDTQFLLRKVEEHRTAQEAYNERWGIVSDCAVSPQPSGVTCQNGSPVLEYQP